MMFTARRTHCEIISSVYFMTLLPDPGDCSIKYGCEKFLPSISSSSEFQGYHKRFFKDANLFVLRHLELHKNNATMSP